MPDLNRTNMKMMKSIKTALAALVLVTVTSTSCDDFLDIQPYDQIDRAIAFRDADDFEFAINGVYNSIRSGSYWGSAMIVVPEMMTDNVVQGELNNGAYAAVHYWNHTSVTGEFGNMWLAAYRVILNANAILEALPSFEETDRLREIKAEALIARAMAHFDLVRCFAKPYRQSNPNTDLGVPIRLVTDFVESIPRNTIQQVYDQVETDLNEALQAIESTQAGDISANTSVSDLGQNRAKFSKGFLYALWTRVAFEKGDWDTAFDLAELCVNYRNGLYRVDSNLDNVWTESASNEIIFQIYFVQQDNPPRIGWTYVSLATADYVASQSVLSVFTSPNIDERYSFYFTDEVELDGSVYNLPNPGPEGVIKHRTSDRLFDGQNNAKVIRLPEVLLSRAEAALRKSTPDVAQATDDLNAVRVARGLDAETVATLDLVTQERRRELCFEGDWWFYRRANGEGFFRVSNGDCQLDDIQNCTLQWSESDDQQKMVFPIPQGEVDANTEMAQNPGY